LNGGCERSALHPFVSILIPLYNSAATIERAVRSAQAQTLANIEILVADDASTDDGAARVEAMAASDPRIRVFRFAENGGKPRAMNSLIAASRGEWVAVLDADDAFRPRRLEVLIEGATRHGKDMAADNLNYVDSGAGGGEGRFVQFGFDPAGGDRILSKADLVRDADSFAEFDLGILKPVIRRPFLLAHDLRYYEHSRLAEDFSYLMEYFVAGGQAYLAAQPFYDWTMPFGPISRLWTTTGAGPWRYDYRPAIAANAHFIEKMSLRGETDIVAMLHRRTRQYQVMVHYLDAQRLAGGGRRAAAVATILRHPSTLPLMARRIAGRITRAAKRFS
jgi:succinoglycan biosynthesis protein ExoO